MTQQKQSNKWKEKYDDDDNNPKVLATTEDWNEN